MDGPALGKLTRIRDIRSIWAHERFDFSAWLLENGDYLAEVLEIDLELERAEEPVGDFSLDLIGRDLTNEAVLIVENQLEATDHSHLGQVLLYAAGTGAGTIVWISPQFRAEHRQALNWLNENTGDDFHFFGVEVTAIRVDDSLPAPMLSLAVQPSEWQKRVREKTIASGITGKAKFYVDFWPRFIERAQAEHPGWTKRGPGVHPDSWLDMSSGISGAPINACFSQGKRLKNELYIDSGDADKNLELFRALESQEEILEGAYGRPLTFEELPNRRACRVAEYFEGADVTETERHDEFIDWFFDCGERLRRALAAVKIP
jgi:Domain of unknown function (DUF4268)